MAKAKKCTYIHTRVATGFLKAFYSFKLTTLEMKLISWILEKTYGEYEEDVPIIVSQLARDWKVDRTELSKALSRLVKNRVVIRREKSRDRFYRMCENLNLWKLDLIVEDRPRLEKIPSQKDGSEGVGKTPHQGVGKTPHSDSEGVGKTPHSMREKPHSSVGKTPHSEISKPASSLASDDLFKIYIELERVNGSRKKDFIPLSETQSSLMSEVAKKDLVDPTIRYLQRWGVTMTDPRPITNWLNVRTESPQEILQALVVGRLLTKDLQRSLKADGKRICADPVAKNLFYAAQHLDEVDQPDATTTTPKPNRAGLVFFEGLDD